MLTSSWRVRTTCHRGWQRYREAVDVLYRLAPERSQIQGAFLEVQDQKMSATPPTFNVPSSIPKLRACAGLLVTLKEPAQASR